MQLTKFFGDTMCTCKLFIPFYDMQFSCDEIREKLFSIQAKFRKENGTDELIQKGMKDRAYIQFCKELDDFLDRCPEKESKKLALTCSKCSIEEHEGHFCRCEGRNMMLARQLRKEKHASVR